MNKELIKATQKLLLRPTLGNIIHRKPRRLIKPSPPTFLCRSRRKGETYLRQDSSITYIIMWHGLLATGESKLVLLPFNMMTSRKPFFSRTMGCTATWM